MTYRPGAFRLLHDAPAHRLTDRRLPVSAVCDVDAAAAERAVLSADLPAAPDLVQDVLRTRVPRETPSSRLSGLVVDAIVMDRSLGRVEQVADRFGFTVRRLQRLFADHVGVSPKWVLAAIGMTPAEYVRRSHASGSSRSEIELMQ